MAGVVILREDDEGARIVRPAAEDMEIERAPQRGRARRRLHPRKRVSVTHTPPAFHVGLHPWGQIQRKVTLHRNWTGNHAARRGTSHRHRKEDSRPSVGIPCWPSRGSTDIPGARAETLHQGIGPHSRPGAQLR